MTAIERCLDVLENFLTENGETSPTIADARAEYAQLRADDKMLRERDTLQIMLIAKLRADLEKQRNVAVKYALIVEQFQKLLGVYTTTAALSKVAVLMREESVVDAEIASYRAELDEWENAKKFVADGCTDEIHCGCVPILKRELDAKTKAVEEARNLLDASVEWVEQWVGIASAARGLPEEIRAWLEKNK